MTRHPIEFADRPATRDDRLAVGRAPTIDPDMRADWLRELRRCAFFGAFAGRTGAHATRHPMGYHLVSVDVVTTATLRGCGEVVAQAYCRCDSPADVVPTVARLLSAWSEREARMGLLVDGATYERPREPSVAEVADELHALVDRWRGFGDSGRRAAEELAYYLGIRSDTVAPEGRDFVDQLHALHPGPAPKPPAPPVPEPPVPDPTTPRRSKSAGMDHTCPGQSCRVAGCVQAATSAALRDVEWP